VDINESPLSIFSGNQRIARYFITRARVGADIGTTFGNRAELRVGAYLGGVDANNDTGLKQFPQGRDTDSGVRGRFVYDTRDRPELARKGGFASASVVAPREELGAEDEYVRAELDAGKFFTSGPNTVFARVRAGTSFDDDLPFYDQFTLGGFLKLSGYTDDQFRGNDSAFGSLTYTRQIATLTPPLGRGLYLGGSLEVGRLWDVVEELNDEKTRYGSSLFFAADSWLGPAYLGVGLSGEGNAAVYFLLGRP
jgi:NTE family protein